VTTNIATDGESYVKNVPTVKKTPKRSGRIAGRQREF